MIKLEDITVVFNKNTANEFNALDGLSLTIYENEFVVVIGGNGAGKSTLMNLIAGNVIADSGKIFIDSSDVTLQPTENRAKLVARVFQDPMIGTFADLTVAENYILFAARSRTKKLSFYELEIKSFRDQLARLNIGLENRLNQRIGLLSGGQRQLLSLMMSLAAPASILLLDEHTAALDPKIAAVVMEITAELIAIHKITTIMVTHNMKHAAEFGDRIIVMNHGKCMHDISGSEKMAIDPVKLWKETQDDQ